MPMKYQTRNRLTYALGLGALACVSWSTPLANAQDALGDGRALDANPGQYGRNNYQRPSLADELRFRNSIATGNAPGGLSFRGDLGYRASGEFTGELGSDSLFAFRRDSLYSGLAGMGIRGTDALQYQFALTTGATPPRNLMGNLSYSRQDLYSSSANLPRRGSMQADQTIGIDRDQYDLDPTGQALSTSVDITGMDTGSMMGTLRSSSTYNTTSTMQPSLMNVYSRGIENQPVGLIASPLLGITSTPLVDPRERPANPLVTRPPNADTDASVPGNLPSTKIMTSYDDLVQEMRDRVQTMREAQGDLSITIDPSESNDTWLVRQMEDIRRQLYGVPNQDQSDQGEQGEAPTTPGTDPQAQPGTEPGTEGGEEQEGEPQGSDPIVSAPQLPDSPLAERLAENQERIQELNKRLELQDPTQIAIDPDTREVLRGNAANEIEMLMDPNADQRDLYSEHMLAGQRLIANARYFDAEERFTHALSIKPGDVVARQGRLHAQIGAGMLLSASVNLQALYTERPELITTRYSGDAIPAPERLEELKERLSVRAGITEPQIRTRPIEGDRIRVSAGLLLAYLGYQSKDEDSIRAGIRAVRELGSDSDRRFANLLEQLWLDQKTTP